MPHKGNRFPGSLMEPFPQLGNRIPPWIAPAKVDACLFCMLRHIGRGHDDVFQNRAQPAAPHRPFHGDALQQQRCLPHHPQHVISELDELQNKFVCLELPGRELFRTEIRFYLAVVLLHLPMPVVEFDNLLILEIDVDGVHVAFDLGNDVILPVMVTGTLRYVVNCPYAHGFLLPP